MMASRGPRAATSAPASTPCTRTPRAGSLISLVGRSARSQPSRPNRLPLRAALTRDRPCPASTGHRHHDARRQGHVSNDWRVCRVRTRHDRERVRAGVARAKASGTKSGKAFGRPRVPAETEQRIRDALATPGRPGFHKIAAQFGVATGRCSGSRRRESRRETTATGTRRSPPRRPPSADVEERALFRLAWPGWRRR